MIELAVIHIPLLDGLDYKKAPLRGAFLFEWRDSIMHYCPRLAAPMMPASFFSVAIFSVH